MNINKKGMMDDLFDFMFTVIIAFFSLLFIGAALSGGVDHSNSVSIRMVSEIETKDTILKEQRFNLLQGKPVLDESELEEKIGSTAPIHNVKEMRSCSDYGIKEDCQKDELDLHKKSTCRWYEDKCEDYEYPSPSVLCFFPGTKIYTPNGEKNIEVITVGDKIFSFDFLTGSLVVNEVVKTDEHYSNNILKLTVDVEGLIRELKITALHPLFVYDKGKVLAKDVVLGDFVSYFGQRSKVMDIEAEKGMNYVYNIEVATNFDNYFADGFLVYNEGLK